MQPNVAHQPRRSQPCRRRRLHAVLDPKFTVSNLLAPTSHIQELGCPQHRGLAGKTFVGGERMVAGAKTQGN